MLVSGGRVVVVGHMRRLVSWSLVYHNAQSRRRTKSVALRKGKPQVPLVFGNEHALFGFAIGF